MDDPFITYEGSLRQASHDIEKIMDIIQMPARKWTSPAASDLRYILRNHVELKKGRELTVIKNIARLYVLTRLLTAEGFPKQVLLSKRVQWQLVNIRNCLMLRTPYACDTYEIDDFTDDNGATEKVALRRRDRSMCFGMLMACLEYYDFLRQNIFKRQCRGALSVVDFTAEEAEEYRQTLDDCFYLSRDLLGELTERIDGCNIVKEEEDS